jgi:hypothetical protein
VTDGRHLIREVPEHLLVFDDDKATVVLCDEFGLVLEIPVEFFLQWAAHGSPLNQTLLVKYITSSVRTTCGDSCGTATGVAQFGASASSFSSEPSYG